VPLGEFPKIPAFNIPLGALIPKETPNFIVAEKSISVSNIVNGATRTQPVALLIGQAAGVLAAISAHEKVTPQDVPVRRVQDVLLKYDAYLIPYCDVSPKHPHFRAIQRIGATGILRGVGEPHLQANRVWFYPDSTASYNDFYVNLSTFQGHVLKVYATDIDKPLLIREAVSTLALIVVKEKESFIEKMTINWTKWGLKNYEPQRPITKAELAVLLDATLNPFEKAIGFDGQLRK
jgi:hypothetical protein